MGTSIRAAVFIAVSLCAVGGGAHAEARSVRWYLADDGLNEQGNTLNLGDAPQDVSLKGGWSCSIGATSKQMPAYEARTTVCRNAEKSFEFTVQCETLRAKDHVQIRFKDREHRHVDFIEVGCELAE